MSDLTSASATREHRLRIMPKSDIKHWFSQSTASLQLKLALTKSPIKYLEGA
jgi:hypothetical protein